jgi:transcriptional regulator with XRE-family HTH domain
MDQDDQIVSEQPLPVAIRELMAHATLSFRGLAAETRRHDPAGTGLTHGHLGQLAGGHEHPSQRALQLLAAAFGIQPEFFVEYRLAELRRELNERQVGYEHALRTLRRFDHDPRLVA